jgi:hypothetical protein
MADTMEPGREVTHSTFDFDDLNKPHKPKGLDFAHIAVSDVNFKTKTGAVLRDSIGIISGRSRHWSRADFRIKGLSAMTKVTLHEIQFCANSNWRLHTAVSITIWA